MSVLTAPVNDNQDYANGYGNEECYFIETSAAFKHDYTATFYDSIYNEGQDVFVLRK